MELHPVEEDMVLITTLVFLLNLEEVVVEVVNLMVAVE